MTKDGNTCIRDYALIGNCRACALVSKNGAINWCCLPEFHSPAIFSAMIDSRQGGSFFIQPANDFKSYHRYIQDTNVVETFFENAEGTVRLTDCFVALSEEEKRRQLFPDHEILRVVECLGGEVKMKMVYCPTLYYGRSLPRLQDYKKMGIHFGDKENIYVLVSTLDDVLPGDGKATAGFTLSAGEKHIFSFSCSSQHPAIIPEVKHTALSRLQSTTSYWKAWTNKCRYNGVYREQVIRSILALKLLTHAPSGSVIAAPTTSLPEEIGGERNWDYRYCWLRDASFTIRVFVKLGYHEEAHAYMNWILHATRLTQPRLQVVYNVFGNARIKEKVCAWLVGYKGSVPVRIGNAADRQFQLDVYGEVLDAVFTYTSIAGEPDKSTRDFCLGLGKVICKCWQQPDEGIWEIRSQPIQHTHSKVMAWVGLHRLITLGEKYNWKPSVLKGFSETAALVKKQVEEEGFNTNLNTYTRALNDVETDASLLVLPLVDYCRADDTRMKATQQLMCRRLSNNGFLYRNRNAGDGLKGSEGAFLVCNFWMAENLAKSGRLTEAKSLFAHTVQQAGDTGLLAEEIDPDTKELLGNYPQGFSHIGLINAAMTINEALQKEKSNDGKL